MKIITINEILRENVINTYYTCINEYMYNIENDDENIEYKLDEFGSNIELFIEEQKINFEEKVISKLKNNIKSSKYKKVIYLILLQDAFELIKTEQIKKNGIDIYEKDIIVHLENLDIDRLINLLDFDDEILFDIITLFLEYNLQSNFNDKYRNRTLIRNSNSFEYLKKFKLYMLDDITFNLEKRRNK